MTTTDPERTGWKKQHVVSMENSQNIFKLAFFCVEQKNELNSKLGQLNKWIELYEPNFCYRETNSNELPFLI